MTKEDLKAPPANISEFNTITGLVFTQLYKEFPVPVNLDRAAIESAMNVASSSSHVLQSGKSFTEVFVHSLNWLSKEGYVRSAGPLPHQQVTLTIQGLATLNAIPQGLSTTIGSTLATTAYVSIGTMHLAKGLEFRAVAVMACDDEIMPLQERIETVGEDADLQEVYDTERHLLYVACTRARDHLIITGVEPASEFLDDLRM
jgi:superfamily I DNA/RNA helicase